MKIGLNTLKKWRRKDERIRMESYIQISHLNDFIFCPRSIYFHQLYGRVSSRLYHRTAQVRGLNAHKSIDTKTYTTSKSVLQGIEVYSEKYDLCGKIDIYDKNKRTLTERKKRIRTIYDGYIFQIYAQYFCLKETGYSVEFLKLYSMDDNKSYSVNLPENDIEKFKAFELLIDRIREHDLTFEFTPNVKKCEHCIYSSLCDASLYEEKNA